MIALSAVTDIEPLGCTLCFKCNIPYDEFTEMGQHDWWFRMKRVEENSPGFEWVDLQCPTHRQVHRFSVLIEYWCPPCSKVEVKRIEKEEGGHHGRA